MKRHPALLTWSREHHAALVLAKRAQRLTEFSPDTLKAIISEVNRVFSLELAPHFHLEEQYLLPALLNAGQAEAVERTLAEHAELRSLVDQLDISHPEVIHRFGKALADHVRFEERELFPLAESALSSETLADIELSIDQAARPDITSERQHEPS
ncbi:MAG: hemerythrin domain-containing protein [Betaproteobacteria bacterium]